jgi:competence protein ComEC
MNRPLLNVTISFMAGIMTTHLIPFHIPIAFMITLVILLLLGWLLCKTKTSVIFLFAAVFMTGALRYHVSIDTLHKPITAFDGKQTVAAGKVVSEPEIQPDGRLVYTLETDSLTVDEEVWEIEAKLRINVRSYSGSRLYTPGFGDRVILQGTLRLPDGARNPGGFDARFYYAGMGVSATLYTHEDPLLCEPAGAGVKGLFVRARNALSNVLFITMPDTQATVLNGILFGIKNDIPEDVAQSFSDAGIAHILAVSGLHVGFVIAGLYWLLNKLPLDSRAKLLLCLTGIFLYTALVGLRPSVMRAGIMAAVLLVGKEIGKESDPITSLAFAGLITASINPLVIFTPAFQMSYGAVIGILSLYHMIHNSLSRLPNFLRSAVAVSISAQLGVLPVCAYYFHRISLISCFCNIFIIPVSGIVVGIGFATALVGQVSLTLAGILGMVNVILLNFVMFTARLFAHLPYSALDVLTPPVILIILWYGIMLYIACGGRINLAVPKAKTVVLMSLSIINLIVWSSAFLPPKGYEITFLDVNQGDAIFIRTPEGYTALIDSGPDEGFDAGKNIVVPFLRKQGVNRLNLALVTHYHDDHIGGLPSVLDAIGAQTLLLPAPLTDLPSRYRDVFIISAGDRFKLGDAEFTVLNPIENSDPAENNSSLVLLADFEGVKVLFTGDIEYETETILADDNTLVPVDVLKVAHHGSDTSSTKEFLESVQPRYAVISVGRSNRFGHPSDVVLQRLENIGSQIYRTDIHGSVTIKIINDMINVKTFITPRTNIGRQSHGQRKIS